jgi:hypothetical protein
MAGANRMIAPAITLDVTMHFASFDKPVGCASRVLVSQLKIIDRSYHPEITSRSS